MTALSGKRFLVAEDNAMMRRMVCETLAAHGAQVTAAEDGKAAVRRFAEDAPFDAVLMDVSMRGMDGYAAARAIRKMDRRVLIFAHSDAGTQYGAEDALKSGMDGCVQKPVTARKLAQVMECA